MTRYKVTLKDGTEKIINADGYRTSEFTNETTFYKIKREKSYFKPKTYWNYPEVFSTEASNIKCVQIVNTN